MAALPAFSAAMAAARASHARASLLATVVDSVRYAGTTGTEVVVCPGAGTEACVDTWDWSGGWSAFADLNGNRAPDAHEPRIALHGALPTNVRLQSTSGRRRLVFQPSGGNAGSNVTFTLCDSRGASRATSLVMSNAGGLREATASAQAASACVAAL